MFIGKFVLFFTPCHHFVAPEQEENIAKLIPGQPFDGEPHRFGSFEFHSHFPKMKITRIENADPSFGSEHPKVLFIVCQKLDDIIGRYGTWIGGVVSKSLEAGAIIALQSVHRTCPDITVGIL